ncbi:MAG: M23 family metallopeptidase [Thermoanaerobacteraceae bacterium]|uniref:M23 family metallopeptidase n=1 Tax=Thermanaeromonas sp. C210 TaxID=2731925 RepID=UPI00155C552E|nr:M23 family metallopeptidase [Thermanaeromonas sp. C210]MBE3580916.1 M23 family metallopeptidase [Thermoanaerobacteraceae bacterium]GFN21767.1 peptidase M23 [Thermanaeromonas sp. C210]
MGQNLAEVIHVAQKLWEILRRSTAHLGRVGRILKRRGLYLLFLTALLAGAYYLVTNDAVFRGGQKPPSLPVEGPAGPVAKPLPREPLSGAESVPEELQGKSGAHPAAATEEDESAPAARQEEFTLVRPVEGKTLTAFGFAWAPALGDYRFHRGLDLEGKAGQEVRAAAGGTVSLVEYSEDWRYRVVVDASNGYQVAYANLDSIKVAKGARIEAGDVLGTLGHPGRQEASTPVHLHLEVLKDGRAVDPAPYLQ